MIKSHLKIKIKNNGLGIFVYDKQTLNGQLNHTIHKPKSLLGEKPVVSNTLKMSVLNFPRLSKTPTFN